MTKNVSAGAKIETNVSDALLDPNAIRVRAGTIGGFAQDKGGKPVLISCSHVIFFAFQAPSNLRVYSPTFKDTSCCGPAPVAKPIFNTDPAYDDKRGLGYGGYKDGMWFGGFNVLKDQQGNVVTHKFKDEHGKVKDDGTPIGSEVDCAKAELLAGVQADNSWQISETQKIVLAPPPPPTGTLYAPGVDPPPENDDIPKKAQYVRIYSELHGTLQYGTLLPLDATPTRLDTGDAVIGAKDLVNQYEIIPRPTPPPSGEFTDALEHMRSYKTGERLGFHHGESGAFVINSDDQIIAMLVGGFKPGPKGWKDDGYHSPKVMETVTSTGLATPIHPILEVLKVTIPQAFTVTVSASGPDGVLVPGFGPGSRADANLPTRRVTMERLRERLLPSVRGRLLLGLIARHRREVQRLLTTVAPAAAAWRSLSGPAYYSHCVRSVDRAGHQIPSNINGISRERLVKGMLPLLHQHGSDNLRRDLDRYASLLIEALLDVASIMDAPDALARPGARV